VKDINRLLTKNPVEALENSVPYTSFERVDLSTGRAEIHGTVELLKLEKLQKELSS